jgi:hypothetical protein
LTWTDTGVGAKPQRTNAWLAASRPARSGHVIEENLLAERQLDGRPRLLVAYHHQLSFMR